MLFAILIWALQTAAGYLLVVTLADICLMGVCRPKLGRKAEPAEYLIKKENWIDLQTGLKCAGFSAAYLLRHYGVEAEGDKLYSGMPNKQKSGTVYPKGICRCLAGYGYQVTYCMGNLNMLKRELQKGRPVIVMIRCYANKSWLHYVPVVGYDEKYIYIAESLPELVNCQKEYYNRRVEIKEFKRLWNTAMLKMPFYRNTFYS